MPTKTDEIFMADKMLDHLAQRWDNFSPQKRRETVIKIRNLQSKIMQRSIYGLMIVGLLIAVFTIFSWINRFNLSQASSAGVIIGFVISVLATKYALATRKKSFGEIYPDDFTDDDILAYIQTRKRIDKKWAEQWEKKKGVVAIYIFVQFALLIPPFTKDFAIMVLNSSASIFLIGFSMNFLFNQKGKKRKSDGG
jgi:hypothetical protein